MGDAQGKGAKQRAISQKITVTNSVAAILTVHRVKR